MAGFHISELPTLKRLADVIPDAVYVVDRDFNLVHVNRRFRNLLDFRGRLGTNCAEAARLGLCHDSCVLLACIEKKVPTLWEETIAGKETDLAVRVSAGAAPLLDDAGNVAGAFVMLRDVDAEVRAVEGYRVMLEKEREARENLEQVVAERTKELRSTNLALVQRKREVQDILDNIHQAVFTVDKDLRIGREHSRYVETVFGELYIADKHITRFLVPAAEEAEKRQELADWFKLVFSQPALDWDTVVQLVPREYRYHRASDSTERELLLDFRPIRDGAGAIVRVMIVAEDLTEKKALERAVAQKEQENEENLEQIAEIIQLDPGIFHGFLVEAEEVLADSRASLRQLAETRQGGDVIHRLFRQMHTLKGNARSFKLNKIASKAHWVEDTFATLREAKTIDAALVAETETRVADLEELLERVRELAGRVGRPGPDLGYVRSRDRSVKLTVSRGQIFEFERALRGATDGNPPLEARLAPLFEQLRALTLVPMSKLFGRFPKMTHDLAADLGKEVSLELSGAVDTLLDAQVLHLVGNPIVHALRNAVDHGIEPPDARKEAGKPPAGRLTVQARYARDELLIELVDDGRGIDGRAVVRKAIERGLVTAERGEAMSDAEAIDLVFLPGLSTSTRVTDVSGRGVGMDVVRATLKELGGTVTLRSTIGRGTELRLAIPRDIAEGRKPIPG